MQSKHNVLVAESNLFSSRELNQEEIRNNYFVLMGKFLLRIYKGDNKGGFLPNKSKHVGEKNYRLHSTS